MSIDLYHYQHSVRGGRTGPRPPPDVPHRPLLQDGPRAGRHRHGLRPGRELAAGHRGRGLAAPHERGHVLRISGGLGSRASNEGSLNT